MMPSRFDAAATWHMRALSAAETRVREVTMHLQVPGKAVTPLSAGPDQEPGREGTQG